MAQIAVHEAIRLGATFADARFEVHQHEDLVVRNGSVRLAQVRTERGLGLRVLVNGAWGFSSASQPTRHDAVVLARRAVELGRAAAIVQLQPVELAPEPPHSGVYRTPIERDPLAVGIEDKIDLLLQVDQRLRANPLIKLSLGKFSAHRARKLYVSSEGSEIDQELVWTSVGYQAGASDGSDFQVRSYPSSGGEVLAKGWELVEGLPLLERAEQVAEEAVAQLKADPCPNEITTVILDGEQLAVQVHESCGHPAELDRVLGAERNFAGTSFLTPDRLGQFEFGSPIVNLYADARQSAGLGTFGFDDEGVEGQRVELVSEGRFSGYLSSRESARRVGLLRSSGAMRASGWAGPPLVRMTNVCLAPGEAGSLEDLIADTKSGVLMETGRSLSIDDQRLNFQFGCEVGWEIKDGKRTRRLKNPIYAGITPLFWRSCDAVCSEPAWRMYGISDCGKGQPIQILPVGHGTAPARFLNVEVGAKDMDFAPPSDRPTVYAEPDAATIQSARPSKGGSGKKKKSKKSSDRSADGAGRAKRR